MMLRHALILSLVTGSFGSPIAGISTPNNATYIPCSKDSVDPICQLVRQPNFDVVTEITHPNGTKEIKKNLYTPEQLRQIRLKHNVASVEHKPGDALEDRSAAFISSLTKRESAPPVCWSETQRWYDQQEWGYWYQAWHQVGSCFYCDKCSESISTSFAVSQTWTYGLNINFNEAIQATFGFSWGQTFGLSDTRTCEWDHVQYGCHTIEYQALMSYHNGYANYQTHTQCSAGQGQSATDTYYDHNWAFANVNQAANGGLNQGSLGCDSGCQGDDHRQCLFGNNGGSLWPYAN